MPSSAGLLRSISLTHCTGSASAQKLPTQTAGVVGVVIFSGDKFFLAERNGTADLGSEACQVMFNGYKELGGMRPEWSV